MLGWFLIIKFSTPAALDITLIWGAVQVPILLYLYAADAILILSAASLIALLMPGLDYAGINTSYCSVSGNALP